ncbi:MAG: pyruvate kinase, partial [Burkholderiaceae bacterium]
QVDKVVITATQMMESMIHAPVPTRAEVSDVANAVLDGTDAVMLSAETAVGDYPLETVSEMVSICQAAEEAHDAEVHLDDSRKTIRRIDQAIAMGALFTAQRCGAKAMVALTDSGSTALWMSRFNMPIPIYALTPRLAAQRRMAMYRNVRPLLMDTAVDRDQALADAEAHLLKRGIVQSGDIYAITCGEPMGAPGGTNMLKMCRVG